MCKAVMVFYSNIDTSFRTVTDNYYEIKIKMENEI